MKIVIIGAGFGGLEAAKALSNAPVEVTLIDRQNHHCFQPLLYQVSTATLSPADVAWPIRAILWLFWGLAHVYFLIGLRNRIAVAFSWAWDYLTFGRRARLITEPANAAPADELPAGPPTPPSSTEPALAVAQPSATAPLWG